MNPKPNQFPASSSKKTWGRFLFEMSFYRIGTFLFVLFLICIPFQVKGQFAVIDNANLALSKTTAARMLQQLENTARQIEMTKSQIQYAANSYQKQLETLRGLPEQRWNDLSAINNNIRSIDRATGRMQNMVKYVEYNYRALYDDFERLDEIANEPGRKKEIDEERDNHMREEVDKLASISAEVGKTSAETEKFLEELKLQMENEDLTPQQQREINAQLTASLNQQIAHLQMVISNYAEFRGRQYRMEQDEEDDQKAAEQGLKEQQREDWENFKMMHDSDGHPILYKEGN